MRFAELVDIEKVQAELDRIAERRQALKREQGRLRVQAHRLRKLLESANS